MGTNAIQLKQSNRRWRKESRLTGRLGSTIAGAPGACKGTWSGWVSSSGIELAQWKLELRHVAQARPIGPLDSIPRTSSARQDRERGRLPRSTTHRIVLE